MLTLEDVGSARDKGIEDWGGRELEDMAFRSDLFNKVAQTERKQRGRITGVALLPLCDPHSRIRSVRDVSLHRPSDQRKPTPELTIFFNYEGLFSAVQCRIGCRPVGCVQAVSPRHEAWALSLRGRRPSAFDALLLAQFNL